MGDGSGPMMIIEGEREGERETERERERERVRKRGREIRVDRAITKGLKEKNSRILISTTPT